MTTQFKSVAWSGWVIFSALLLMIIGVINVIQGIIGLIFPNRTVVTADRLYVVNANGFALMLIVFGAVLTCVGIGLLAMLPWARVAAIVLVALHAITQIGWLAAYPVWSLLMLALDVVVLYALTAKWSQAREALGGDYEPPPADTAANRDVRGQHSARV